MDAAHNTQGHTPFLEEVDGAQWAGARGSVHVVEPPLQPSGTLIGLAAMAVLGFILVAHTALAMQPRVAAVRVAEPVAAVETAERPERPRPEAVGPDPEVTDNGFLVQPWRWHEALTVSERVTLRASPGDQGSDARGTVQEGRAIRVIGLVAVSETEAWLQVRTENGGVAYVDAEDVVPVPAYRERERAEAARVAAEARAETQAVDLQSALGAMLGLDVPPSESGPSPPPPAEPGELY